jgi:hypothetical protein
MLRPQTLPGRPHHDLTCVRTRANFTREFCAVRAELAGETDVASKFAPVALLAPVVCGPAGAREARKSSRCCHLRHSMAKRDRANEQLEKVNLHPVSEGQLAYAKAEAGIAKRDVALSKKVYEIALADDPTLIPDQYRPVL